MTSTLQTATRFVLGGALVFAGVSHLTFAREGFEAQVPRWVPFDVDDTVLVSGIGEIAMGAALVALPKERHRIGVLIAAFLAAVFPGNLSQHRNQRDALGLDTDTKRAVRLPFQPVMIAAVLWSTGVLGRS
ncbi:hypothetical protein [uncultured Amnibacterium sp.]|uniref:DoxX family protein n=1 Tax=uncultured Amnibacterium sp. TaxID=1631851 RepID=UPI0035CC71E1